MMAITGTQAIGVGVGSVVGSLVVVGLAIGIAYLVLARKRKVADKERQETAEVRKKKQAEAIESLTEALRAWEQHIDGLPQCEFSAALYARWHRLYDDLSRQIEQLSCSSVSNEELGEFVEKVGRITGELRSICSFVSGVVPTITGKIQKLSELGLESAWVRTWLEDTFAELCGWLEEAVDGTAPNLTQRMLCLEAAAHNAELLPAMCETAEASMAALSEVSEQRTLWGELRFALATKHAVAALALPAEHDPEAMLALAQAILSGIRPKLDDGDVSEAEVALESAQLLLRKAKGLMEEYSHYVGEAAENLTAVLGEEENLRSALRKRLAEASSRYRGSVQERQKSSVVALVGFLSAARSARKSAALAKTLCQSGAWFQVREATESANGWVERARNYFSVMEQALNDLDVRAARNAKLVEMLGAKTASLTGRLEESRTSRLTRGEFKDLPAEVAAFIEELESSKPNPFSVTRAIENVLERVEGAHNAVDADWERFAIAGRLIGSLQLRLDELEVKSDPDDLEVVKLRRHANVLERGIGIPNADWAFILNAARERLHQVEGYLAELACA